jgi:hypothetical protein
MDAVSASRSAHSCAFPDPADVEVDDVEVDDDVDVVVGAAVVVDELDELSEPHAAATSERAKSAPRMATGVRRVIRAPTIGTDAVFP